MCFVSFQFFIADDGNIPKRLLNMIHTAGLVLKFLINLQFKQLGDVPNFVIFCCVFLPSWTVHFWPPQTYLLPQFLTYEAETGIIL